MATPNEIITMALSKLGIAGGAKTPRQEDLDLGLSVLKSLYRNYIGSGALGRPTNKVIEKGTYEARENDKIVHNSLQATVELPLKVRSEYYHPHHHNDGRWDYGFNLIGHQHHHRLPRNGAFVIINDLLTGNSQEYIYDGYTNKWVSIHDMALDSETVPFSSNLAGLAARLAMAMADFFNATTHPMTMKDAQMFDASLIQGFGDEEFTSHGHYF